MVQVTIAYLISFFLVSVVIFASLYFWCRFMEKHTKDMERLKVHNEYEIEMARIRGYKKGFEDAMNGKKMNYRK